MEKLLVLALFFLLACNSTDAIQKTLATKEEIETRSVGRYQLISFPNYTNRSILLDTSTGRIWRDICYVEGRPDHCDAPAWTPDIVLDITMDKNTFYSYVREIEAKKKK